MEKYFYIPNIKLIGYGRCQTYQISCLKCGKLTFSLDKYTCQYCGYNLEEYTEFRALHIDHIKPWSAGGSNKMNNLSVSCSKCNLTLSDKWFNTFEEKKAYLLNINENKRIMRRKPYLMI